MRRGNGTSALRGTEKSPGAAIQRDSKNHDEADARGPRGVAISRCSVPQSSIIVASSPEVPRATRESRRHWHSVLGNWPRYHWPRVLPILLNKLVLLEGIELSTSPLPRECSTTELQQRRGALRRESATPVQAA
jgi:hypothetical protein